jgi:hypothetical protein
MQQGQPFLRVRLEPTPVRRQSPRGAGAAAGNAVRRAINDAAATTAATARSALPTAILGPGIGTAVAPLMDRQTVVAAREFVEGAATGKATKAPRKAPAAKAATPKAAAQGGTAAAKQPTLKIMPQDRQMAYLDAVFREPLSLRQASLASGMLPASTAKAPTAKDSIYQAAALTAEAMFQQEKALADKLAAAGDREGALAQELKATTNRYQNLAALVGGGDPIAAYVASQTEPE